MAQNRPTAAELLDAVKIFLEESVKPELVDHTAFNMMVALKSLEIVQRELELGPQFAQAERARLAGRACPGNARDFGMGVKVARMVRAEAVLEPRAAPGRVRRRTIALFGV